MNLSFIYLLRTQLYNLSINRPVLSTSLFGHLTALHNFLHMVIRADFGSEYVYFEV